MTGQEIILTGAAIFFARIADVSCGTVRTIITVQGRTVLAFFLGLVEVTLWITIVSTVVLTIRETPVLVVFYAFGFATGNVVGILAERRLALGWTILRIFSESHGPDIARELRTMGQAVTIFNGEGMKGPVAELCIACRRRDLHLILKIARSADPNVFYITENACDVSKVLAPIAVPATGWRAKLKKK